MSVAIASEKKKYQEFLKATECSSCGRSERGLIGGLCDDCTISRHGELFPWLKGHSTATTVNPFTHCPCLSSSGAICGLKFREGECVIHTSYDDSMVIIAAQQAWKGEAK